MDNDVIAFLTRPSFTKASFFATGQEKWSSHNITITSEGAGAGKSSLLKAIKQMGEFTCESGGDFFRIRAKAAGMDIGSFVERHTADPERKMDLECDTYLYNFIREHDKVLIEGRISHCFDPFAFHVYLKCPLAVRSSRRAYDLSEEFKIDVNIIGVMSQIKRRDDKDMRLNQIYPGSIWPEEDFDLIINTDSLGKEAVVDNVLSEYKAWLSRQLSTSVDSTRELAAA